MISRDVVPMVALFVALVLATLLLDALLHRMQLVWVGRYLGIPGVLMIAGSFVYSLRKHGFIEAGNPKTLLQWHQGLAWAGSLLVLVHAGVHFNAVLPWLAIAAMLINVASGLTGRFLLTRARRRFASRREQLLGKGMTAAEADAKLLWDAAALDVLKQWRTLHLPIALAFAALALGHIVSILLFWGWR